MPGATAFLAGVASASRRPRAVCPRAVAPRRRARSPVIMWQILMVVLALGWYSAQPSVWAPVVVVIAAAIGVGLLLPAVVRATTSPRGPQSGS